jgi:antitoxin (DNA-binding transcriptional repressor) of toxin-antitoxin stability system
MTPDDILTRTYAEHEALAPDAETTLAGILDRRPHRAGPVALLAAGVAVAAVVAGSTALLDRDPSPVAGPSPTGSDTTAPAYPAELVKVPLPVDGIALDPTWLPPGSRSDRQLGNAFGVQTYRLAVTAADGSSTGVSLDIRRAAGLAPPGASGPERDVTFDGKPAREWAGAGSHVLAWWADGDRMASVTVTAAGRPAADLAAVARRIATGLRIDRLRAIGAPYTVADPAGPLTVRSVSRVVGGSSYTVLATAAAAPAEAAVEVADLGTSWAGKDQRMWQPVRGRPVLGRPTWIYTGSSGQALWIDEVRPGRSLTLTATDRTVTLDQLYAIAAGVRWTG